MDRKNNTLDFFLQIHNIDKMIFVYKRNIIIALIIFLTLLLVCLWSGMFRNISPSLTEPTKIDSNFFRKDDFYEFSYHVDSDIASKPVLISCADPILCEYLGINDEPDVILSFPGLSTQEISMLRNSGNEVVSTSNLYRFGIGIHIEYVPRNFTIDNIIQEIRADEGTDVFITSANERATYVSEIDKITTAYLVFDPREFHIPDNIEGDIQTVPSIVRIELLANNPDKNGFENKFIQNFQHEQIPLSVFYKTHSGYINSIIQSFSFISEKK
jgi:hypothetical protein